MRNLIFSSLFTLSLFVLTGCGEEQSESIDVSRDEIAEYEAMLAGEDKDNAADEEELME